MRTPSSSSILLPLAGREDLCHATAMPKNRDQEAMFERATCEEIKLTTELNCGKSGADCFAVKVVCNVVFQFLFQKVMREKLRMSMRGAKRLRTRARTSKLNWTR